MERNSLWSCSRCRSSWTPACAATSWRRPCPSPPSPAPSRGGTGAAERQRHRRCPPGARQQRPKPGGGGGRKWVGRGAGGRGAAAGSGHAAYAHDILVPALRGVFYVCCAFRILRFLPSIQQVHTRSFSRSRLVLVCPLSLCLSLSLSLPPSPPLSLSPSPCLSCLIAFTAPGQWAGRCLSRTPSRKGSTS